MVELISLLAHEDSRGKSPMTYPESLRIMVVITLKFRYESPISFLKLEYFLTYLTFKSKT